MAEEKKLNLSAILKKPSGKSEESQSTKKVDILKDAPSSEAKEHKNTHKSEASEDNKTIAPKIDINHLKVDSPSHNTPSPETSEHKNTQEVKVNKNTISKEAKENKKATSEKIDEDKEVNTSKLEKTEKKPVKKLGISKLATSSNEEVENTPSSEATEYKDTKSVETEKLENTPSPKASGHKSTTKSRMSISSIKAKKEKVKEVVVEEKKVEKVLTEEEKTKKLLTEKIDIQTTDKKKAIPEGELFNNYSSDFEKEESSILEKIKTIKKKIVAKTNYKFVFGSIIITAIWISSLFLVDPDRHNVETYKTSILYNYNLLAKKTKDMTPADQIKEETKAIEEDIAWQLEENNLGWYNLWFKISFDELWNKIFDFNGEKYSSPEELDSAIQKTLVKLKKKKIKDYLLKNLKK